MSEPIEIYDTTLRDGAQQEGIALSIQDKLRIAALLDDLGVAVIEGGWPGAIPKDTEFFARALGTPEAPGELKLKNAIFSAFGSTCKAGVSAEDDTQVKGLLDSGAPMITLVAKSDVRHVEKALKTDNAENLRMVRDTVAYLVSQGRRVVLDAEHYFDGLAFDPQYGLEVLVEAGRAGAETVTLCDTNGGNLPSSIAEVVSKTRAHLDANGLGHVRVGIHCHNDTGCAVANSIAAVEAGAVQVQGVVNGYGERTGNADLLTCAANIQIKLKRPGLHVPPSYWQASPQEKAQIQEGLNPQAGLAELSRYSNAIAEIVNISPGRRAAYVGASAFAHKAGLHASAIRVDPDLYQHIDPALVGNDMRMLVSEMAGRASVELKAREMGIDFSHDPDLISVTVAAVKEREARGYTYDAADASFELLMRYCGKTLPIFYEVESWRASVQARADMTLTGETEAEATVKILIKDKRLVITGEGNGPVNALDHALRDALKGTYPHVEDFELVDYKVRILDEDSGTESHVRVLITTTDGEKLWTTVGIGTDVIEASWEALSDSMTWGLMKARAEALG